MTAHQSDSSQDWDSATPKSSFVFFKPVRGGLAAVFWLQLEVMMRS